MTAARFLFFVALLICAVVAPSARADKATAKRLTEQATLAYKLGHFQEALEDFSMAYGEFNAPLLLFNIGQCYRELGNYERASFFLRGYLHEIPKAKNRALVEDLITECESKLAAEQAELRRRQEEEKEQRALKLAEANLLAEQQQQPGTSNLTEAPAVDRAGLLGQEKAGRRKLVVGLSIAAVGVVAIALGAYFDTRSNADTNTINQLSAQGQPWSSSAESTYRDGSRSVVTADVLLCRWRHRGGCRGNSGSARLATGDRRQEGAFDCRNRGAGQGTDDAGLELLMWRATTLACALAGLACLPGCSFSPNIGNGAVACGPNGLCPDGFGCQSDNRCYKSGGPAECIPSCVGGLECQNGSCVCTPELVSGRLLRRRHLRAGHDRQRLRSRRRSLPSLRGRGRRLYRGWRLQLRRKGAL